MHKNTSPKITKIIFSILIAGSLSSCGTHYIVPPNTPKATLSIHGQNIFDNNHQLGIYKDPVLCKDLQPLGDLDFRYHGEGTAIPANKMITILDEYSIVNYEPIIMVYSFRPEANQQYVIISSHEDATYLPKKVGNISSIKKETFKNGKYSYTPVSLIKRKLKKGFQFTNTGDCEDRI